ncbi:unnamed protein product [Phytomonas sp. EM1]|nr:unnamed protein product [Phytomonas sp. EM1]|eukprot:CCW60871.1 unnamed protein product [Phytomonas sp. isolate EM1]
MTNLFTLSKFHPARGVRYRVRQPRAAAVGFALCPFRRSASSLTRRSLARPSGDPNAPSGGVSSRAGSFPFPLSLSSSFASPSVKGKGKESRCGLCDRPYQSWREHASTPLHIARAAVCGAFASPERGTAILSQLSRHLRMDFAGVDAAAWERERRRRARLGSTLRHLAERGILREGLPFHAATPNSTEPPTETAQRIASATAIEDDPETRAMAPVVSDGFLRYVLVGEGYAREEVVNRVARLIPGASAVELEAIAIYTLSPRPLARLYDEVRMDHILAARSPGGSELAHRPEAAPPLAGEPTSPGKASRRVFLDGRALVLLGCIGELVQFQRRDRPRSVANKAAAETIVLHVLASHAMENLISELVHGVLQRILHEGTPIWRQFQAEAATYDLESRYFTSKSLSDAPKAKTDPPSADPLPPPSESFSTRTEQLMGFFVVQDACAEATPRGTREGDVAPQGNAQISPTSALPKYQPSWRSLTWNLSPNGTALGSPPKNLKASSSTSKISTNLKKETR